MSISLEKRAEKIGIILAKHDIVKVPPVRVGLALDVSGSTHGLYLHGTMQETVDRLLAVSLKFDDNGELDMWAFDDQSTQLETATPQDYGSYIKQNIMENEDISKWGGTAYGEVLEDMVDFWFGEKPVAAPVVKKLFGFFSRSQPTPASAPTPSSNLPAMGMLVTDGETSDQHVTARILAESQQHNVYWQMVGVGPSHHFGFLQQMADQYPHVGFVNLESLTMSDDEIYGHLISEEFIGWVKKLPVTA